ncbi:hypothetical protein [Fontibacillus phaseoli]|uniref:hypothetical protein n=1 Tax=Fontibacillus phaseoli TaxID=1416533 RepID=UPI0015F12386|nr:hypothetical protein [Fontibacillus phaseoli]
MNREKRICVYAGLDRCLTNQVGWNRGTSLSSLRLAAGVGGGAFLCLRIVFSLS